METEETITTLTPLLLQDLRYNRTIITTIGPGQAAALLELNTDNYRAVSKQHVTFLDNEMTSGRWHGLTVMRLTREGTDGTLTLSDGQHRLLAIITGGHTIEVLFILEEDPRTADVLDTNLTRSLATVLRRHGEKNCSPLGAGLRWGIANQRGELPVTGKVSPGETLQFLHDNPGYRDSANLVGSILHGNPLRIPAGPCVWLHHDTHILAPEWAEFFWDRLTDGTGLEKGNPILALRERLIKNATEKAKLRNSMICAFMIKAWNAYVEGDQIPFLRWYNSGPYKEQFPELHAPAE